MEPQANPVSDAELLRAYVETQSDAAFAQLVNRYINLVYSTSLRRVRDAHLAEDVTQAVFLVLAKKAGRLAPNAILPAWLFKTAKFIAADAIKLQRRRQHHERAAAVMHSSIDTGEDKQSDILVHLETAMDRLPAADRNAILLRYFQGLNISEIAGQMQLADNTTAKRIGRALNRLRSHLLDLGVKGPATEIDDALAERAIQPAPAALSALCLPVATATASGPITLARRAIRVNWLTPLTTVGVTAGIITALVVIHSWNHSSLTRPMVTPASAVVIAAPDPALEPTSPDQELQIRAAVSTLRHFHPWVQSAEWMSAIRTLVQIGAPAVPELVAELDRTNKGSTQRAIAFCLRVIDDARACPALIRASRRTNLISSSLGLKLVDADLTQFMLSNQVHPNLKAKYISFGTPDQEIQAALESLTGYSAGKPYQFRGGEVSDADMQAALAQQKKLADDWQKWWDQHHGALEIDAEMATLTAQPHTVEAVEAAGLAVNGPAFPTGHPYHLGPVQDIWATELAENYDTPSLISFDRQQLLTLIDCLRLLPANKKMENVWWLNPPVSIDSACTQYLIPPSTKPMRPWFAPMSPIVTSAKDWQKYFTLNAYGVSVWPADNRMWETLDKMLEAGSPIPLDEDGPYSDFKAKSGDNQPDISTYPATFLIRTDRGGAGIVQFVETDNVRGRVHVRYRMVEPSPKPIPPVAMAPLVPGGSFGDTKEVTLTIPAPNADCGFDLTKGVVVQAPAEIAPDKQREWLTAGHAEISTSHFYKSESLSGLFFKSAALFPVSSKQFDAMTPELAAMILDKSPDHPRDTGGSLLSQMKGHPDPETAVFRFFGGPRGMIQIISISDNPPSVKFRYKLLKNAD